MTAATPDRASRIDAAYQAQRLRLKATITAGVASAWSMLHQDRQAVIARVIALVTAGQDASVRLVGAYMTAKSLDELGHRIVINLDPARYTTSTLRGIAAELVYGRPFGAYRAFVNEGGPPSEALRVATSSVTKLASTDLQLAQTHAARDWLQAAAEQHVADVRIVGYRRVLTGPGPHCELCTLASTRTYRVSDLMAIHEHCGCTVQPLWGTEPVASVGTSVRVELDPELGPRLMADDWSQVGPRLHL